MFATLVTDRGLIAVIHNLCKCTRVLHTHAHSFKVCGLRAHPQQKIVTQCFRKSCARDSPAHCPITTAAAADVSPFFECSSARTHVAFANKCTAVLTCRSEHDDEILHRMRAAHINVRDKRVGECSAAEHSCSGNHEMRTK